MEPPKAANPAHGEQVACVGGGGWGWGEPQWICCSAGGLGFAWSLHSRPSRMQKGKTRLPGPHERSSDLWGCARARAQPGEAPHYGFFLTTPTSRCAVKEQVRELVQRLRANPNDLKDKVVAFGEVRRSACGLFLALG